MGVCEMSKMHEKKGEKKYVKSSRDIAMERAEAMARGVPPADRDELEEVCLPASKMKELQEKAARADEYYDTMLRAAAELENYKKRIERERQNLLKFGQEELMSDLLLVLDNYERALESTESSKDVKNIVDGIKLIQKQLLSVLKKSGLEPIEALGKPFNPELHEAISQVETDDYPDGTVIGEQLKGYTLNKRLLRPSVVTVSKKLESETADKKH